MTPRREIGPRRDHEPEMMGAAEAAKTLGVKQSNLRVIVGLPEPYQKIRSGTLYRAQDIRALAWERLAKRTASLVDASTPTEQEEVAA